MNFLEILQQYQSIIASYDVIEFHNEESVSNLKIKIRLIDASFLWIREIRRNNKLIAYSYYWMDAENKIITGWDNAPHHKEIKTFPHHKHVGKTVEPSDQKKLDDVLNYIQSLIENKI